MSIATDRLFYERRLSEERTRALTEPSEALRHLHREWATLYERRLALMAQRIDG